VPPVAEPPAILGVVVYVTRAVACALACAAAPLLAACSLDWDVRPDPGDTSTDAASDAAPEGGARADASGPLDAAPKDGASDATDCTALAADVARTRPRARACQLAQTGQCKTTVKDECNCDVVVRLPSSPETDAYVAAVAAFTASCTAACAACPQLVPSASWGCVQNPVAVECYP